MAAKKKKITSPISLYHVAPPSPLWEYARCCSLYIRIPLVHAYFRDLYTLPFIFFLSVQQFLFCTQVRARALTERHRLVLKSVFTAQIAESRSQTEASVPKIVHVAFFPPRGHFVRLNRALVLSTLSALPPAPSSGLISSLSLCAGCHENCSLAVFEVIFVLLTPFDSMIRTVHGGSFMYSGVSSLLPRKLRHTSLATPV